MSTKSSLVLFSSVITGKSQKETFCPYPPGTLIERAFHGTAFLNKKGFFRHDRRKNPLINLKTSTLFIHFNIGNLFAMTDFS